MVGGDREEFFDFGGDFGDGGVGGEDDFVGGAAVGEGECYGVGVLVVVVVVLVGVGVVGGGVLVGKGMVILGHCDLCMEVEVDVRCK